MFDETEWVPLTTAATRLGLTVADIHDLVHENLIPVKHEPLTPISARLLIRVRDVRAYFAFFAQTAKEDGEVSQARKVELLESAGDAFLATIQQQNEQITRLQEAIDAIAEIWTDQSRDFMVTELVHGRILNEGDMDKGTWTRGHGQGDMDKGTWMMPNKKNDINAMFDQMPMRDALVQMGMGGAMHSDEQWASIRDEFLESIAKGLNGVRAQARYQVAETMFRTDENE